MAHVYETESTLVDPQRIAGAGGGIRELVDLAKH